MHIFHRLQQEPVISAPAILTFGVFDGVHLGHQFIFEQMKKLAMLSSCPIICLTFSNHPSEVLSPNRPVLQLTSHNQKIALLESCGFDYIVDIPFDRELQSLSAAEFIIAIRKMIPFSSIITGSDVTFGAGRDGNKDFLKKIAEQDGFEAIFFDRYQIDGIPVSSSHIRPLVMAGDFTLAERFLGRTYSLVGTKISGDEGVLRFDVTGLVLPPYGAYAASIQLDDKTTKHRALVVLSLESKEETVLEVYILDQYEELNVQSAAIQFLQFLRPDRHFSSQDELQIQIEKDKQLANSL